MNGFVDGKRKVLRESEVVVLLQTAGALTLGEPWRLKYHDTHPDAPDNLVYANIRKAPKGDLTDEQLHVIGRHLAANFAELDSDSLHLAQYVVGIPEAGEPLAESFATAWLEFRGNPLTLVHLGKVEDACGRRIVSGRAIFPEGENGVIMVDDACSDAGTKMEAADALRSMGLTPTDCIVLLDREQGGKERVEAQGINFHASFTLAWAMEFLYRVELLDPDTHAKILKSLVDMAAYMATHT